VCGNFLFADINMLKGIAGTGAVFLGKKKNKNKQKFRRILLPLQAKTLKG
jgi:hypothetical protein